jgi:excisionase family DNA binding protein
MKELARRLSICEATVRGAIRDGRLAAVKIGRAVRVRADAQIGQPVARADTPVVRARRIVG